MSNITWKALCRVDEIAEGRAHLFRVNGKLILLGKENGDHFATSGFCTHDGGELDGQSIEAGEVECSRHGARFNIKTGKVTKMPAVHGLAKYNTKVDGGFIYVEYDG